MICDISKIKFVKQLNFDDIVSGNFMRGHYTHWIDGKPMFLMEQKINNEWKCLDYYIKGFASFKSAVNNCDLILLRHGNIN